MTVTHVTGVTGFPTCINCDRKHSLSNREEKLGFGETVRCFFSMLLHVEKPVTPVTLARSTGRAESGPSLRAPSRSAMRDKAARKMREIQRMINHTT